MADPHPDSALFDDSYCRQIDLLKSAYTRRGLSAFPWTVVEDLTLEGCRLMIALLRELQMTVPNEIPTELSDDSCTVESEVLAALATQVIDMALVPCTGPEPDWKEFGRQVANCEARGVPAAPFALAVLAARCAQVKRERWSGFDEERLRISDAEKDCERVVSQFVETVERLEATLKQPAKNSFVFHADGMREWWAEHGDELAGSACDLKAHFERDRKAFGKESTLLRGLSEWMSVAVPRGGDREAHHSDVIYRAYNAAVNLGPDGWQKRGGPDATRRLLGVVGVQVTEEGVKQFAARIRRRASQE